MLAVVSTFLFSPRLSSFSVVTLLVLSLVAPTEAHNWLHTPGRASLQASTISPCQGRKDSDLHAQVGPDQSFTIRFATGHDRPSYFVTVDGDDADWLGHDDFETMVEDYISLAPVGTEDHLGDFNRRYHGFSTSRGTPGSTVYDNHAVLPGSMYTGPVLLTDPAYPKHNRTVAVGMYRYTDSILSNDRRASYYSNKYPWIVTAARFPHFYHLPDDFDAFNWNIPRRITKYGHYIVHWRWSGYYDCVDVDYRSAVTPYPDGLLNASQHRWDRIDHCQYESPKSIQTQCMEVLTDVAGCIRALGQGEWNTNIRYGLNVVPFRNPASVGAAFQSQVAIPWRDGDCSSSWNRLNGPVSETVLNWATWDSKTNVQTGVRCSDSDTSENTYTGDLRRAIAYCVGLKAKGDCVGIAWEKPSATADVHTGVYHFRYCRSTNTVADTDYNMYTPKSMTTATYDYTQAQTTVNFAMAWRLPSPTPGVISDTGDVVKTRNGFNYGWSCNASMDLVCPWCCQSWECSHGCATSGCCNSDIDYTFEYDIGGWCPTVYKVYKWWNIDVPNGVYEVITRHYGNDGNDVDVWGCNVESARMLQNDYDSTAAGIQLTQKVEVADGKLTLNGDGAIAANCGFINWLKFRRIGAVGQWDQHWMPPATANPTWEQDNGVPIPVGIVSIRNIQYTNGGEPICSAWWLFKGSNCYDGRPLGWFNDTTSQGLIVGVSNTSCISGSCPGTFYQCGTVSSVNAYSNDHFVDCNGLIGRYVWVRAPGTSRYLVGEIHAYRSVPDVPDPNDNPLVCYAVEARDQTATAPEYIISLDPEDPIFYSTCYVRNPNVIWLTIAGTAANPTRWRFNGRCVDCVSYQMNNALVPFQLPQPWVINDGQCVDCYKETAPIPPPNPNWVHIMSQNCDDPVANPSLGTARGLPSCSGAGFTSCRKDVRARGRTDNELTYGSEALSLAECQAVVAKDPECSSTAMYFQHPDGWMVCQCYRKHACCGNCVSDVWENTPSFDYMQHIQVYDYKADPNPDQFCARGLKSADSKLCCPTTCKNKAGTNVCGLDKYGSPGCRDAAGGAQCCFPTSTSPPGMVVNLCTASGPPCRL